MKTKEELNALKEEVEALNRKLAELTDDEMEQVAGGLIPIPYFGSALAQPNGSNEMSSVTVGAVPPEITRRIKPLE